MSTSTANYVDEMPESKRLEHSEYKSKDDMKMQQHIHLKENKAIPDPTMPETSDDEAVSEAVSTEGTSLVDGVTTAVTNALGRVNEMLPEKVQAQTTQLAHKAVDLGSNLQDRVSTAVNTITNIPSTITTTISGKATNLNTTIQNKASELALAAATLQDKAMHNSIVDSYEEGGVVAAAKTGLKAATKMTRSMKKQVAATGAKLMGSGAPEKKKKFRRRRGGRMHGNRKYKMKLVNVHEQESILDSLGDKAKELKEVAVDALQPKQRSGESKRGVIQSVREGTSNMIAGVSSKVSGVLATATSVASNATQSIQSKVATLTGSSKDTLPPRSGGGKKKQLSGQSSSSSEKPALDRRAELPALGTPNTPDNDVLAFNNPKMAKGNDQGNLIDKAKVAIGAAKDYVVDKLDNMSLNADDDTPLEEKSTDDVLDKATKSMKQMKNKVAEKLDDGSSTTGTPK